jgi:hypothetical protein
LKVRYPGIRRRAKHIQRKKVYTARKERLLRRMPAQPTIDVMIPKLEAMVERISSVRLPTRTTSACAQTSNHVQSRNMMPARE